MDTVADQHKEFFNHQAEAAVRAYCRQVNELTFIEHGSDNLIVIANRQFVFRFPRNEIATNRLYLEAALLQRVQPTITAIAIPHIIHISHQPFYVVCQYIEGIGLTTDQIKGLSTDEQAVVGRTLAAFMAQLNQAVSGLEVQRLRSEAQVAHVNGTWESYFRRLFEEQPLPNEKLNAPVQQYYALWKDYVNHEQRTYAIHDDLHPENLLFVGSQLSGVLDFGDANIGGYEEELRWLYMMGDTVLSAAIATLQQMTGVGINADHIRVWAIMHELSTFTNALVTDQTEQYPFRRAQSHLRTWIPDFPM